MWRKISHKGSEKSPKSVFDHTLIRIQRKLYLYGGKDHRNGFNIIIMNNYGINQK